ncbi:hypothetical protein [Paenibacillus sp. N3.4]|uniref:hypothetical protein n=1 Tax=Paenibacillus sp. N3.4 TaxID=2603222 RepID=UPI0011CA19BA|nr:hypothetical protein [Paenibacillus sp. N3.4]TXK84087.1 hypothetical protein FU659_10630 [Paenibacillus sp. N3.4]
MRNKQSILWMSTLILFVVSAGCGQKQTESTGQSFGSAATSAMSAAVQSAAPTVSPIVTPAALQAKPSDTPVTVTVAPTASPTVPPALAETKNGVETVKQTEVSQPAKASIQPKNDASSAPAAAATVETKPNEPQPSAKAKQAALSNEINWTQFFDDDKQDKPSDRFWDMSGKTVQIKGFMGEVLSFDKHWFLLIPKPGAECPFDNGDETYWNKIMIVFVPDNVKLRYTSGPLLITGKLDVGIKLDESGYKTMFRLYDASFEK